MDRKRRQKLKEAARSLDVIAAAVGQILDKEQDCLENVPENLMGSERYERSESAAEYLTEALDRLEEAKENIMNAVSV